MLKNHYAVRIEWGDCDANGITFYPNYFAWFDSASWHLFEAAGYPSRRLVKELGVFLPLVEAQAEFLRPGSFGDDLVVESHVAQWDEKRFRVHHVVRRAEDSLLEGWELRCWAVRHPDDPQRLQTLPIPREFRAALEGP